MVSLDNLLEMEKVEIKESLIPNKSNYVRGNKQNVLFNFLYTLDKEINLSKYSNKEVKKYIETHYDVKFSRIGPKGKTYVNYNTFRKIIGEVRTYKRITKMIKDAFENIKKKKIKGIYFIMENFNRVYISPEKVISIVNEDKVRLNDEGQPIGFEEDYKKEIEKGMKKGKYYIQLKDNRGIFAYVDANGAFRDWSYIEKERYIKETDINKYEGNTIKDKIKAFYENKLNNIIKETKQAAAKVGSTDDDIKKQIKKRSEKEIKGYVIIV